VRDDWWALPVLVLGVAALLTGAILAMVSWALG
jgi:hypothetical protein